MSPNDDRSTPFREACMRAWVAGWYAGRDGVLNDDGKRACADKLASEFPAEARAQDLLVALDRLLGSTELNLDEMEPETVAAIVFAEAVRKLVKGEKP
jgi:hypothetical protein